MIHDHEIKKIGCSLKHINHFKNYERVILVSVVRFKKNWIVRTSI